MRLILALVLLVSFSVYGQRVRENVRQKSLITEDGKGKRDNASRKKSATSKEKRRRASKSR